MYGFGDMIQKLKANPKTIVFPEGSDPRILEAASRLLAGNFLKPILLGNEEEINRSAEDAGYNIRGAKIIDPVRKISQHLLRIKAARLRHGRCIRNISCQSLDECRVDLFLHGRLSLAGYLRRDRVLLFVFVVLQLRVAEIPVKETQHISAEIFPYYKFLIVEWGTAEIYTGNGEVRQLKEGECLITPTDIPVGMRTENGTIYTEITIRRTDKMN